MNNRRIRVADYEKLPGLFNPTEFDAAEWVSLAKAAGMKYITITSKHHDGFAMFDSKVSDYDIVDRTPYKKDVLKMLADECHKQGIKLFFYHSQLDWHHPDYFPRGRTGGTPAGPTAATGTATSTTWTRSSASCCTDYGEIGGIWFDGWWDKPEADWRLDRTYKLIHDLQPAALVGNNHHKRPFPGEDFQMFEKDLPGGQHRRVQQGRGDRRAAAGDLRDDEQLVGLQPHRPPPQEHARAACTTSSRPPATTPTSCSTSGPCRTGRSSPSSRERLQEMGQWMASHGESIYGTRGGPITPRSWGVTTQKGDTVYVHLLDWDDAVLSLPALPRRVKSARLLEDGRPVGVQQTASGLALSVPAGERDPYDTVVVVDLAPK